MLKKHSYLILGVVAFLASCKGGYNGQLLGSLDRPGWNVTVPYGMVYIKSGYLHIGQSDQDINNALAQRSKAISVQGFFMDETEITNNEYRQFVEWVRDSIAHTLIGEDYMVENEETGEEKVNWDVDIDWEDPELQDALSELYFPEDQRILGKKEIDPRKLNYVYYWVDFKEAARDVNRHNPDFDRTSVIKEELVNVYPDTLSWVHDFAYSYNEPMTRNYFWHPSFDNYPVIGVSWSQAMAFSKWRTRLWDDYLTVGGDATNDEFRLPTEAEWEYAARGGRELAPYPWGGPYMRNKKGCILANFKPGRGNYPDDGGMYTVKADAYFPNDYGLYNMAGNVSEWTSSAFYENGYQFEHDMNPDIRYDAEAGDPITMKRKVIRGGSWKDIAYMCQVGTRNYEYQDTAKCYVGFRDVITFLGRSIDDRP
ncbi:MAG: SUMF1/EgtB/PvdO family nonheme iron enzyme [Chitinophagales bacterium]|nr:SUMF1/EgtB/PvdO family nonheme iron enzyme [Chitinophagales bacterium]